MRGEGRKEVQLQDLHDLQAMCDVQGFIGVSHKLETALLPSAWRSCEYTAKTI